MKSAALLALLAALLFGLVEGQRNSLRCRCLPGQLKDFVRRNRIQEVEVIPASPSCPNLEFIAKLKDGSKTCLNPQSQFTQNYIESLLRKAKGKDTTTETDASSEAKTSSPVSPSSEATTSSPVSLSPGSETTSSPVSSTITMETAATENFTTSH